MSVPHEPRRAASPVPSWLDPPTAPAPSAASAASAPLAAWADDESERTVIRAAPQPTPQLVPQPSPPPVAQPFPQPSPQPVPQPAAVGSVIATLPPQALQAPQGHPFSPRTGEPRRPVLLAVACGLLYGGGVVASAGLLKVLWDSATIAGFPTAARVLTWIPDLKPVSVLTVVMVLLIALVGVAVAAAAGVAAYNAWNGHAWSRIAGLVAVAVSLLTILLNPLAMVAMAPIAVGAGLLWLPPLAPYFAAWQALRRHQPFHPHYAGDVHYGPLPRYV